MPVLDAIAANLARIQGTIAAAAKRAGRDPERVRIIAVTKSASLEATRRCIELGLMELAESRVEAAREKIQAAAGGRWHMIGNVQRRKAAAVVKLFDMVDAVDRLELAEALQRRCEEFGKRLPVLIEVNASGETSKHGFLPEDVDAAVKAIRPFDRLVVRGLMTMAPYTDDMARVRLAFSRLTRLADDLGLPDRSMGMSNDYQIAVEEGATEIRIGSALFEPDNQENG